MGNQPFRGVVDSVLAAWGDGGSVTDHTERKVPGDAAASVCRFDQFDQDAAGVLRVHEVDPGAGGAPARLVVDQAYTALAQRGAGRVDVGNGVGDLLDAGLVAGQELGDAGVRADRGEQLDAAAGRVGAHLHHRLPYPLIVVLLDVDQAHTEDPLVELDGFVEVVHRHADVIDTQQADPL